MKPKIHKLGVVEASEKVLLGEIIDNVILERVYKTYKDMWHFISRTPGGTKSVISIGYNGSMPSNSTLFKVAIALGFLKKLLSILPEDLRKIWELAFIEDLDVYDVAIMTGLSSLNDSTTRSRILRKIYKAEGIMQKYLQNVFEEKPRKSLDKMQQRCYNMGRIVKHMP